ncbi:MAG TPA: SLBB domain-containing protein [Planctomycetota bacterium]|nr:SLBB domain-containing protein [Planctomycetota bacterium]
MKIRMRGSATLCAFLLILAGCDGDQDGRLTGPAECPEADSPTWLQEALATQTSVAKTKDDHRSKDTLKAPPKHRDDLNAEIINEPLETRSAPLLVRPLAAENINRTFRGDVPARNARSQVGTGMSQSGEARTSDALADTVPVPEIAAGEVVPVSVTAQRAAATTMAAQSVNASADIVSADDLTRATTRVPAPSLGAAARQTNFAATTTATQGALQFNASGAAASGRLEAGAPLLATTVDQNDVESVARAPLSRIERLYYLSAGLSHGRRLEQFGYRTFAGGPRTDGNIPPDPEFVMGPGDELRVKSLDGFVFPETALIVDREGNISIGEVGAVKVAGLKYKDVYETIRAAIAKAGKQNFRLEVSLGRLHGIRVRIDGFVRAPGLQLIGANSTLTDALLAAGGPTKDGTLRDVVIQRPGQPDVHVDLYNMIAGNTAADTVLLANDRVFVGPIGPTAAVIGPAGSGIYELADKTTLAALMVFVGRVNNFTQLNNVQVERTFNNLRRAIQTIDYTAQAATYAIQDGDVIAFSNIVTQLNDSVAIAGAVVRPGAYPWKEGMRVSDLIKAAGNLTLDASLRRAMIQRPLGDVGNFDVMVGDRAGSTREETIWVELSAIFAGNADADIPLRRLDTLKIFTNSEDQDFPTVRIMGAVRKPGIYRLTAGLTLSDLISMAGGPTPDAFAGENRILRREQNSDGTQLNIKTYKFRLDDVLRRVADYDLLLENQDQVVINRVQAMQVSVRIGGRVKFPGTHVLPDGSKLSNLIAEAGGLLPDADLRGAVFTRRSIQRIQQTRLDDLFARMDEVFADKRNSVIRGGTNNEGIAAHLSYLGLGQITANIERFQARGRLVINLTCDDFLNSHHNVVLEDGDELYIPRRENIVMVMGEANYPNAFVWNGALSVQEYIDKAGGFNTGADKKQIYVVMANGEVRSDANKNIFGGGVAGFRPGPGDTILIPKAPPKRDKIREFADIALLVRQFAEAGLVGATIPQATSRTAQVQVGLNPTNQTPPDIINNQAPEQFYNDTRARAPQNLQQQNP